MDLGISGRTAIISGGSRGIGRATATLLAEAGVRVAIVARNKHDLREAAVEIEKGTGGKVLAVAADMVQEGGVQGAVRQVEVGLGPIDIAVSNVVGHVISAGEGQPGAGHFLDVSGEDLDAELRQLALSAWHLARIVVPNMRRRRWGRVVNVGSRVAREPNAGLPHALPNIVRPLAAGYHAVLGRAAAPDGVTVNGVLTGGIATERNRIYHAWLAGQRGVTEEELIAQRSAEVPLRRMGSPAEIASLLAFFCSEPAGAITGQLVPVDGGASKHLW